MNDASCKSPGNTSPRRHSRALTCLAALVALLTCFLLYGATARAAAASDTSSSARISLATNDPAVSASGQAVTISGTVTNTGSTSLDHPVMHVAINGDRLLDTRSAAEGWISGKLDLPLTQVATGRLTAIAPGATTPFSVTIPGKSLDYPYGLASLPMTVTVTDGNSPAASAIRGTARSTLHLQNAKVSSPLRVSVVIPLTLPADPDLFGPTGAIRAAAWERAVGPGSTVQQTLDAFAGQPVIFAVDPELLDPPAAADDNVPTVEPTESPTSSPSPTSDATSSDTSTPDPTSTNDSSGTESPTSGSSPTTSTPDISTPDGRIDAAVDSLGDALSRLDSSESVWWLPSDDPDVNALHAQGKSGTSLAERDFARALPAAAKDLGTTRVLWPTGDAAGSVVTSTAKSFTTASKTKPIAILPTRAVAGSANANATYRASQTSGLLTYDESLSKAFSSATTSPGVQSSRLLTALLAMYQESPGTSRSLALVAPRNGGANPTQLADQVASMRTASWVKLQTGTQTETALQSAPSTKLLRTPTKGSAYPQAAASAITSTQLADLAGSRGQLSALQDVMVGGADILPARKRALDIVGSTRWRGAAAPLDAVSDRNNAAVSAMLDKLSIRSSTINFFADSGDITVTVSNELGRAVHNVQLALEPGRNPGEPRVALIKVTDGVKSVDIDASSRATTRFHIKAVGGGTVPVDAVLRAPNGALLNAPNSPQLKINVHPTSGWIMWVLGALAALILVIGLWRAIRRGPRKVSEPTAADKPTPNEAIVDAGTTKAQPTNESTDTDD